MTYKAEDFIKAIPGSGGIITTIADRVGCAWNTAKKYIDEHPTVMQAYTNEKEKMLDVAESKVLKSIQEGDVGDAKWYLGRKGTERGYGPKAEVAIDGALEIVIKREGDG